MKYRTQILRDSELIEKLARFFDNAQEKNLSIPGSVTLYFGEDSTQSLHGPLRQNTSDLRTSPFSKSKSRSIQAVEIAFSFPDRINSFSLKLRNGVSHYLVEFIFPTNSEANADIIITISSCLQLSFPPLQISPLIDGKVEELITDLQHVRDAISAKTESAIGELTASIADTHKQSTERIDELIKKREAYFEELAEKHRNKVSAEEKRISDHENALRDKEIALNLKEPIGERRRIHADLRERLQTQISTFKPSSAVNRSRVLVRLANAVLIGLSIGAFVFFAIDATNLDVTDPLSPINVFTYLKLLLSAAAAFGFSAAYIKWEGRVADHLSETEFRMRDKAVDVERSAWLVETVEALNQSEKGLPDGLLPLLANNLFEHRDSHDSEAEEFAHFLQHLVGKKGKFEANLPGGGSLKLNSEGRRPRRNT